MAAFPAGARGLVAGEGGRRGRKRALHCGLSQPDGSVPCESAWDGGRGGGEAESERFTAGCRTWPQCAQWVVCGGGDGGRD
eukprot:363876-Chlamydomonas_euryale.AAC.1